MSTLEKPTPIDSHADPLLSLLRRQKDAFRKEGEVTYETRIDRLRRLKAFILENKTAFAKTTKAEFGGARSYEFSLFSEFASKVEAIDYSLKNLKQWMKPISRRSNKPTNFLGGRSQVRSFPKGVVGIISPWNLPFGLTVAPLTNALAAGNRALLKPSEFVPETAALFADVIPRYFAPEEVAVVTGGADISKRFAELPFDHLLFTGSTAVDAQIMKAAAENLVPVTLELGGKSPVVIGRTAQLDLAAEAQAMYPKVAENEDYAGVINERHFERLEAHLEDAVAKGATLTIIGAEKTRPIEGGRRMPLHILQNVDDSMTVMQEEIFGPILPILPYQDIAEVPGLIEPRSNPLALYYFGKDRAEQEYLFNRVPSGGVCVNDVTLHYVQEDLPFGGIGSSGMGAHHGPEGFRTMSHERTIYRQTMIDVLPIIGARPPFGEKSRKNIRKVLGAI